MAKRKETTAIAMAEPATNSLALSVPEDDMAMIEQIVSECSLQAIAEFGQLKQQVMLANGIQALRSAITQPMMDSVMSLQGSPLGFLTDLDGKGGYQLDAIRDCFIESLLRGLRSVGNEWNIIAGKCYTTKNGFKRLVSEYPGLTNLKMRPFVPTISGDSGLVPIVATWEFKGDRQKLECIKSETADERIPVKVNKGMGPDAVLGKAYRKMYARIYEELSGQSVPDGEVIDGDATVVEQRPAGRRTLDHVGADGQLFDQEGDK